MKILVNTTINKSGGGQKVALNFISGLIQYYLNEKIVVLCIENSPVHRLLEANPLLEFHTVPEMGAVKRMRWEILHGGSLLAKIRPDVIYTVFGYSLFSRKYPQVMGEANSNLYFPEIDFWQELSRRRKVLAFVRDRFRLWTARRAAGVVFENPEMMKQALSLRHFPENRVCYIKPSIVIEPSMKETSPEMTSADGYFRLLMLAGWQYHKNFMILPCLMKTLKDAGKAVKVLFSVSPTPALPAYVKFMEEVRKYDVGDRIELVGTVPPEKLPDLYRKIDAVLLLSRLESFSNNIIEAWKFGKPLIVSDAPWARNIVKEGGCFVPREDAERICEEIIRLIDQPDYRGKVVKAGAAELESYPSIEEHIRAVLDFVTAIGVKTQRKTN